MTSKPGGHNGVQHRSAADPAFPHAPTCHAAPTQPHDDTGGPTNPYARPAPKRNETHTTGGGPPTGPMPDDPHAVPRHVCYDHLCHGDNHADLWQLNGNTEQHLRTLYPKGAIINITVENNYHKVTFKGP